MEVSIEADCIFQSSVATITMSKEDPRTHCYWFPYEILLGIQHSFTLTGWSPALRNEELEVFILSCLLVTLYQRVLLSFWLSLVVSFSRRPTCVFFKLSPPPPNGEGFLFLSWRKECSCIPHNTFIRLIIRLIWNT